MPEKILIIDGMNMFIRCFVAVPVMDIDGNPIGGVTGFLKSVKSIMRNVKPDRVIVAWDGEGGSRKRRDVYSEYKSGRKVRLNRQYDVSSDDEYRENMSKQLGILCDFLELLGVVQIRVPEVEADDVIAFLCGYIFPEKNKVIVSTDKDMLQLVNSSTVVFSPTKKVYWTSTKIFEEIGILPENYIYVKALMGDASDNIKGLGGIGEKTAIKLFPFFGEKETNAEEILSFAMTNIGVGNKYKSVVDKREKFLENIRLMQLSSPVISPQSARSIRISALEQKPKFIFSEFKLGLIRTGIQMLDQDFMSTFQAYQRLANEKNI